MDISSFFSDHHWDVAGELDLPARDATVVDAAALPLGAEPARFLQHRHADGIFAHQDLALRAALANENVCVSTGTSSGKSLVFQTAALQHLSCDPEARIIAIYPMKALGNEQEERWRAALAEAGIVAKVARIDGSVRRSERAALLRGARVAIMTPDIIHAWLMPSIALAPVQAFVKKLKLVVVDEIHTYTGVFGSNSAMLFRRLQHLLVFFAARPQWIAASATLADADGLLKQLFGLDFTVIGPDADTSRRHPVDIKLVRPPGDADFLSSVAALLGALADSRSRRFIAFVDSRKQTEHLTAILARGAGGGQDADGEDEELVDHLEHLDVLPYRAGYEARDRDVIQKRLTNGTLPGVVSTSALELGLDIPALDTAVLIGVPRSSTSLHQRIGRIGRHGPGQVLVISSGDIYDESVLAKPEELLRRPHVEPALYLENRRIQYIHALCLARPGGEHDTAMSLQGGSTERPFTSMVSWPEGFVDLCRAERVGEVPAELQSMKVEAGEGPNFAFPLRDVERQFKIELRQGMDQRDLGSVSYSQLLREAYPGAIYYYTAKPYRVASVKLDAKVVRVREERAFTSKPTPIPTRVYPNLQGDAIFDGTRRGALDVLESEVQIREALCGYRERRGSNEIATSYPTDSEKTGVFWYQPFFGRTFFSSAVTITHPALDADAGAAQAAANYVYEAFLMAVPVERRDVGVAVDAHRVARGPLQDGRRFIALYDQTYGSLRISGRVLEADLLGDLLTTALELCHEDEESPERLAALPVLRDMVDALDEPEGERWWTAATQPVAGANLVPVILPGSLGLQLLHDNREFHVQAVFFSPHGLKYRGTNSATRRGATDVVPLDQLVPLEGVSEMGFYDLETGEIVAGEPDDAPEPVAT
jgi:DEAD/DEAH box helicase domain-containing protein